MTIENTVRKLIASWIDEYINHVASLKSMHIHFDSLVSNADAVISLLPLMPQVLVGIVRDSLIDISTYKLIVAIPLKSLNVFDAALPAMPLPEDEMDVQPAAVYIACRTDNMYYDSSEEYKYPMLNLYHHEDDMYVIAYYRVWRSGPSFEDPLEYGRALYFEVVPKNLLLGYSS